MPADRSPSWWIFLGFVLVAAWFPGALRPIADVLQIELISNFVLAAAVLFLVFQLFSEIATSFHLQKTLRQLVSGVAARDFRGNGAPSSPRVLVVVPCHNEQEAAPAVAQALKLLATDNGYDFCFVNDASTDATERRLNEIVAGHVVGHHSNVGVSGVLMTGFTIARDRGYDYVVQCDGDGQHPVQEIPRLIASIADSKADLVIGSRFAEGSSLESTTRLRRMGSLVLVAALRLLFPSVRIADPTSGFRVYSKNAVLAFLTSMPERYPEPETIALAARSGLHVLELPVKMAARTGGTSSISGLGSVWYMVRVLSALLGLRLRSYPGARRG